MARHRNHLVHLRLRHVSRKYFQTIYFDSILRILRILQFGIYSSTIVNNITHNDSSLTVVFGWATVIKFVSKHYMRML